MKSLAIPFTILISAAVAPAEDLASSFLATASAPPKIQAGKTTTLAAGKPAKVKSRVAGGVTYLDFSIPQGAKGNTGAAGPAGPAGPPGPKGEQSGAADKHRSIYVPARALAYPASAAGITQTVHGVSVAKNPGGELEFTAPKPPDWDPTTPISVTVYFSVIENSIFGTTANWTLFVQSVGLGHTGDQPGIDMLENFQLEKGTALPIVRTTDSHAVMAQTWTSKWSSKYSTWYFADQVSTSNDFIAGSLWKFGFYRSYGLPGGETAANTFEIICASVDYQSK